MRFKEIEHTLIERMANVATIDAVVHVGIHHHIKLIALRMQFGNILHRIDNVHIIVGTTPHDEQFSLQAVGMFQGRAIAVAVGIFLRSAHKALSIDGVVESPRSDRSNCHAPSADIAISTS